MLVLEQKKLRFGRLKFNQTQTIKYMLGKLKIKFSKNMEQENLKTVCEGGVGFVDQGFGNGERQNNLDLKKTPLNLMT